MSHDDIYARIESIADDSFKLQTIEKLFLSTINKSIKDSINTSGGNITGVTETVGSVVKKSLRSFYATKQYQSSLMVLLRNVKGIGMDKLGLYKNDGLTVATNALNKGQKLAIDYILDAMNENGLNAKFNQPLRNLIYENVTKGSSLTTLQESLKKYIISNPEKASDLSRYFKQISQNGADAYSSVIDQKIAEKYAETSVGYMVVGSLINNSSKQCRHAVLQLDRIITKKNFEGMKKIGLKSGMNKDTTFENLPIRRGHPGCRHSFVTVVGKLPEQN
jgi:hypothetical protein